MVIYFNKSFHINQWQSLRLKKTKNKKGAFPYGMYIHIQSEMFSVKSFVGVLFSFRAEYLDKWKAIKAARGSKLSDLYIK